MSRVSHGLSDLSEPMKRRFGTMIWRFSMYARTHKLPSIVGVLLAALIGIAARAPAMAATHITYGALVPVTANVVDAAPNSGGCGMPDAKAQITRFAAEWLKADSSGLSHADTQVLIELDSIGNLLQVQVNKSSGSTVLDQQALAAARGSKYAPEVRNCSSFKQSYYVDIMFDSPTAALPQGGNGR